LDLVGWEIALDQLAGIPTPHPGLEAAATAFGWFWRLAKGILLARL
jgi:hypothetical protein